MPVPHTTVHKAIEYAKRAGAQLAAIKEKSEETLGKVTQTIEVGGTAFGFGLLNGRYGKDGKLDIAGIPVDLLFGLLTQVAGFLNLGGRYDEHLHNMGDGALAHYLAKSGLDVGMRMQRDSHATPVGPSVKGWDSSVGATGSLPSGYGEPYHRQLATTSTPPLASLASLTREELEAMARGAQ